MSELINNRAGRIRVLKEVIKHLHEGEAPDHVRDKLRELVRRTDYTEIVAMEEQLMAEGMPVEEIRSMCDLHSQVTREVLVPITREREIPPGHPVETFRAENEALRNVTAIIRQAVALLRSHPSSADETALIVRLRQCCNELMDVDKHYQRKENALFSCMERHGITGPSQVMWAKDDEVRALLKTFSAILRRKSTFCCRWRWIPSLTPNGGRSGPSRRSMAGAWWSPRRDTIRPSPLKWLPPKFP
jgi:DUF438 domain-containing protein